MTHREDTSENKTGKQGIARAVQAPPAREDSRETREDTPNSQRKKVKK